MDELIKKNNDAIKTYYMFLQGCHLHHMAINPDLILVNPEELLSFIDR